MPTVKTIFIDASTGKAIGQADMPGESLPASFAVDITLHLADQEWRVLKAEPLMAEEFLQTGKLVLTLQKIVKVPIDHLLFTLPTLCDAIPGIIAGSTKRGKHVFELHEDDWRQLEFISSSYRSAIDAELEKVRHIYREASVKTGTILAFKTVHVRQQLNAPLLEGIRLSQLTRFFTPMLESYEGISYQDVDGLIEGGFAFQVASLLLYGQQDQDRVNILGLKVLGEVTGGYPDIAHALQRLMEAYHLYLVDWCKPQLLTAQAELLETFLLS